MVEKATNPELKSAFEQHLAETQGHVRRIEEVFEMHGVERQTASCPPSMASLKKVMESPAKWMWMTNKSWTRP
jgi:ferritin-like metal-binding protein YciE